MPNLQLDLVYVLAWSFTHCHKAALTDLYHLIIAPEGEVVPLEHDLAPLVTLRIQHESIA